MVTKEILSNPIIWNKRLKYIGYFGLDNYIVQK